MLTKAPLSRARTIVRTEAGRVQEQANFDAANKAKAAGADVVSRPRRQDPRHPPGA